MRPRQSPAWNKYYTVIARAFMPVAISYMEQVQQLHRPHVWDCFVGYAPRNDGVTRGIMSLRGHLCPRQSPTWNKYSNYTVLMT